MLEDSNALVFMEAIKSVECLTLLLGKNVKPQKIRQFIALLADKVTLVSSLFSIKKQKQLLFRQLARL